MGLSDIASGIEVTAEQRDRGVLTVDETSTSLEERLERFAERLPCDPEPAATLVEAYAEGAHVGRAAAIAEVPETTATKTLYLLGEPIDPLSPTAKRIVDDWLAGELSRSEALALAGVEESEFALGAYVATHEPIEDVGSTIADALAIGPPEDALADARSDLDELVG